MSAKARKEVVHEGEIGIYRCWFRCVRGALLMGHDPITGMDYDHRPECLCKLIIYQSQIFAIDLVYYNILPNHFYVEARTRPGITDAWDDEEIAWRWKCAWPSWEGNHWLREPAVDDIQKLLCNKEKLAKARAGLASLSRYMARIKEPVAKLFNKQDKVQGHFFESETRIERAVLPCIVSRGP